ncbi:MAG: hypothetical protein WAT93_11195 [Pontixanthobacter sp.]
MTTQIKNCVLVLLTAGILASGAHANSADDNSSTLRTDIVRLQADVAQLRTELASLEQQAGVNGPEYRIGSTANRRVEVRGTYGSITIDKEGIAIQADKIRLNGKAITVDASRTFEANADAILFNSRSFQQKGDGDLTLKGKAIRQN